MARQRRTRLPHLSEARSELRRQAELRGASAPRLSDDEREALLWLGKDRPMSVADDYVCGLASAACARLGESERTRLAKSIVVVAQEELKRCDGRGLPNDDERADELRATIESLTADYGLPTEPARQRGFGMFKHDVPTKW